MNDDHKIQPDNWVYHSENTIWAAMVDYSYDPAYADRFYRVIVDNDFPWFWNSVSPDNGLREDPLWLPDTDPYFLPLVQENLPRFASDVKVFWEGDPSVTDHKKALVCVSMHGNNEPMHLDFVRKKLLNEFVTGVPNHISLLVHWPMDCPQLLLYSSTERLLIEYLEKFSLPGAKRRDFEFRKLRFNLRGLL